MKIKRLWDDTDGSSLVEFTLTLPLFLSLMFGITQAGILLFTQAGLQHGVEAAARCASVNYSAYQLVGSSTQTQTSCFGVPLTSNASNTVIKTYARNNSWGVLPPLTSFTVTSPSQTGGVVCGANNGFMVTASYGYNLIGYLLSVNLVATSCFPINVS